MTNGNTFWLRHLNSLDTSVYYSAAAAVQPTTGAFGAFECDDSPKMSEVTDSNAEYSKNLRNDQIQRSLPPNNLRVCAHFNNGSYVSNPLGPHRREKLVFEKSHRTSAFSRLWHILRQQVSSDHCPKIRNLEPSPGFKWPWKCRGRGFCAPEIPQKHWHFRPTVRQTR